MILKLVRKIKIQIPLKIKLAISFIFFITLLILISVIIKIIEKIFKFKIFKKDKIIFGTHPIINNKYWAECLKNKGYKAETFMYSYYSTINKKEDFDKYFDDVIPDFLGMKQKNHGYRFFFVWLYLISNTKILVRNFHFIYPIPPNLYSDTIIEFFLKLEKFLLKFNSIKIITLPYGSDSYMYSRIRSKIMQNAILISYPEIAKYEKEIEKRVFWWSKYSDVVVTGLMSIDGFPRWDICIPQICIIDTDLWKPKQNYSDADGKNEVVKILHSPNHRGLKGTEFLIKAVEELKNEGLKVKLILMEKVQNEKVKEMMQEVDILAEQFIIPGYGLNGIEGMASGLPVLANIGYKEFQELFTYYSFLGECPILPTDLSNLKENLRILITNPALRKELGIKGRKYVEKYHSYKAGQFFFESIFQKLEGKDIDLINLYHPIKKNNEG